MGTRWTRVAALSGVVFVILVVASVLLGGGEPGTNASAGTIQRWYLAHHAQVSRGAFFGILSVAVGLFFYGYLRAYFRTFAGNEWLSATFFGGAIVFGVSGTLSSGIAMTATDSTRSLSPSALQLLNTLGQDLNWAAVCAGLAVLYAAAGFIILRSAALPKWLGWVSVVFAVTAATVILSFIPFIGTAVWVLVVSIILARRNPAIDVEHGTQGASGPALQHAQV